MTTVTEERGRLTLYAIEPPMNIMALTDTHTVQPEQLNRHPPILGVMAALGAYALTSQICPAIW